jgi:hypothetical protein
MAFDVATSRTLGINVERCATQKERVMYIGGGVVLIILIILVVLLLSRRGV